MNIQIIQVPYDLGHKNIRTGHGPDHFLQHGKSIKYFETYGVRQPGFTYTWIWTFLIRVKRYPII